MRYNGKMFRKVMAIALAGTMILGNATTVSAATLKDVFDAEFYAEQYEDLEKAFGNNKKALYNHYLRYGSKEGRTMSALINVQSYREAYPDLDAAFGDDWNAYVNHYLTLGIKEGRNGFGSFDARAYADRYPDLKAAFGYDVLDLYKHYVDFGREEGRDAGPNIVVQTWTEWTGTSSSSSGSATVTPGAGNVVTYGCLTDPETGATIPNATIRFIPTSYTGLSEVVDPVAEDVTPVTTEETTPVTTEETTPVTTEETTPVTTEETTPVTTENTETPSTEETTEPVAQDTAIVEFDIIVIDYLTEAEVTSIVYSINNEGRPCATVTHADGIVQIHTLYAEEGEILWHANLDDGLWGGDYPVSEASRPTEPTETPSTEETTESTETEETETPGVVVGADGSYTVTTDENGNYVVPELPTGVYSVTAEAPGYLSLTLNSITVDTTAGSSFTLPTFQMLSADGSGTNTATGQAMDATTGMGIANATIKIRSNWNNTSGDVVNSTITDANGNYSIPLERGYYTLEFVVDGYASSYINLASSNAVGANSWNCVLNPVSSTEEVNSTDFRIVLTWNETPEDLDSHLVGPEGDTFFHVYYADKEAYNENGEIVASLDVDDVTSYGPETVTVVSARTDSTYYYSIHDYTNGGDEASTEMSASGANVKVYQGSTLMAEYNVPLNQTGYVWNVFKIENGSVVGINEYNANYYSMFGNYYTGSAY